MMALVVRTPEIDSDDWVDTRAWDIELCEAVCLKSALTNARSHPDVSLKGYRTAEGIKQPMKKAKEAAEPFYNAGNPPNRCV